ncbi:hypothetical protein ACNVED_11790 [Legionella sp. D16C41]|uniref:hypothetical protein n=1 Tax=Legionella sp. D16C41 TaxID=3402688 RepID=UPI003AF92E6E
MRLNKLVLHCYNLQKEKGVRNPLDDFIRDVNPIILSTCMRHIYVFDPSQIEASSLEDLLSFLDKPRLHQAKIQYDCLEGIEGYSFLLMWAIGALNKNKFLEDHRVLEALRKTCRDYEGKHSGKKKESYQINKKFLNALLLDANRLHKVLLTDFTIKDKSIQEKLAISEQFKAACDQCAEMRDKNFLDNLPLFDYRHFFSKRFDLLLAIKQALEGAKENLNHKLMQKNAKKDKQSLRFFSKDLDNPHSQQEQIELKISNLEKLLLNLDSLIQESAEYDNESITPEVSNADESKHSLLRCAV